MTQFYLRELAHARSGDKGDTSNIGVIAYREEFYPLIAAQVTVERVRTHFRGLVKGASLGTSCRVFRPSTSS